jgi:hypothetical protein
LEKWCRELQNHLQVLDQSLKSQLPESEEQRKLDMTARVEEKIAEMQERIKEREDELQQIATSNVVLRQDADAVRLSVQNSLKALQVEWRCKETEYRLLKEKCAALASVNDLLQVELKGAEADLAKYQSGAKECGELISMYQSKAQEFASIGTQNGGVKTAIAERLESLNVRLAEHEAAKVKEQRLKQDLDQEVVQLRSGDQQMKKRMQTLEKQKIALEQKCRSAK